MRTHISTLSEIPHIKPGENQSINYKPDGFWYGVDGDWERWCRSEQWGICNGMFEYDVILSGENILVISTVLGIDEFHDKYAVSKYHRRMIDWPRVCSEYDGIEIAPYQWERRHDGEAHAWYYSWDCASGCVWRPKGVSVKMVRTIDFTQNCEV
jgi:hypothetical protein